MRQNGFFKGLFRAKPTERQPRGQSPVITSTEVTRWNNFLQLGDQRRMEVVRSYRQIYRSGGIVRTAIDSYGLFMFAGGWELQSDDSNAETLQEIKDTFFSRTAEFDGTIQQITQDALCIGDGYAKLLKGSGRLSNIPVALQHIPAERIKPHIDETMAVLWYDLYDEHITQIIGRLRPEELMHLCLQPGGGEIYGVGLLESAWDDIKHDVEVSEGTAAAIKRHGYGIWHAKVASTDPETKVTASEVQAVKENLQHLSSRSEVVTTSNIEIVPLNEAGQAGKIGEYSEWTVTRLCTALGIPGELLGLRQGSTDATAVSRIENYYKKIQAYQQILSYAINTQFIDPILASFGKEPGSVWIEYLDPSPEDNIKRATYVASIAAITPGDPYAVMSQQQMQNYLGIDHGEWQKDEEFYDGPRTEDEDHIHETADPSQSAE